MTLRNTLLAATMLALPLGALAPQAAQAQPVTGLYIAGGGGVNWHSRAGGRAALSDFFGAAVTPGTNNTVLEAHSSPGFAGVFSLGWGFGNGVRLELEGNLRHNDVERVRFVSFDNAGRNATGRQGTIRTYGVMVNALYDIGATMGWPVHISVGGGIGYAWHRWENVGGNNNVFFGDQLRITDTDAQFAYQGIVGLSYPIRAVPGLAITGEYRYFATLENRLTGVYTLGGARVGNATVKADNENHSVMLGVRYNFGRGRPAAPVAARPADARSFLVFFDFDRADLTPRAREILGQAAQASRTGTTRVEVAGHADRSGTPQYNQGLSQRRANNTAAELVRLGVPRGAISVAAFGESRPLVPTADGVREPQNRRVEIVLR